MARIRTIKPDAFMSESLSSVPRGTRWTFAGLWTYCDDAGRGRDDARLIWAALYPLDHETTVADVETDLELLVNIGAIIRYVVDGKRFLVIPAFDKHQASAYRRTESRLPSPDHGEIHTPSHTFTQMSAGSGSGSGSGSEEETPLSDKSDQTPERFEEFWTAYDNKQGRKKAEAAYRAALKKPGVTDDLLITAASSYVAFVKAEGKHPTYTKHPTTWLNGEHWNDERTARTQPQTRVQGHLALAQKLADEHPHLRQIGPA